MTPGTRVGTYEVVGLLGAGGMGEVYRARDSKLNRQVALKILPELFAAEPDRLARFNREAQVLASLNHPNIATNTASSMPTARTRSSSSSLKGRRSPNASPVDHCRSTRHSLWRGRSLRP